MVAHTPRARNKPVLVRQRVFITGCMAVGDCSKKLPPHGAAVPSAVINANNKV